MEHRTLIAPHAIQTGHSLDRLERTQERLCEEFLAIGHSCVFDRIVDIRHDAGAPGGDKEDFALSGDGLFFQRAFDGDGRVPVASFLAVDWQDGGGKIDLRSEQSVASRSPFESMGMGSYPEEDALARFSFSKKRADAFLEALLVDIALVGLERPKQLMQQPAFADGWRCLPRHSSLQHQSPGLAARMSIRDRGIDIQLQRHGWRSHGGCDGAKGGGMLIRDWAYLHPDAVRTTTDGVPGWRKWLSSCRGLPRGIRCISVSLQIALAP